MLKAVNPWGIKAIFHTMQDPEMWYVHHARDLDYWRILTNGAVVHLRSEMENSNILCLSHKLETPDIKLSSLFSTEILSKIGRRAYREPGQIQQKQVNADLHLPPAPHH